MKINRRHLHYKETQEDIRNSLAPRDLFVIMSGEERGQRGRQRKKKSCTSLFTWAEGKDEFELCQKPENSGPHM